MSLSTSPAAFDEWWAEIDDTWYGLFSRTMPQLRTRCADTTDSVRIRRKYGPEPTRTRARAGDPSVWLRRFEDELRARVAVVDRAVHEHELSPRSLDALGW